VNNGNETSRRLDRVDATLERVAARLDRLVERHDALTARHEALSQTVEFIAGMQAANEKRIEALAVNHAKNEKLMAEALEAIHSLGAHRPGA
jgi:septal ring factor EnvC (AmiA/AmiB activator)